MSYNYKCIKQRLFDEIIGDYITYGIELTEENMIVNDVSCNREKVNEIVRLLNIHQASPLHAYEIIENLLSA